MILQKSPQKAFSSLVSGSNPLWTNANISAIWVVDCFQCTVVHRNFVLICQKNYDKYPPLIPGVEVILYDEDIPWCTKCIGPQTFIHQGGRFKNTCELLNLRALKSSPVNKICIFQCMDKIFCVEFQRYPLKFHTKYLTHRLKDIFFHATLKFLELLDLRAYMHFWNAPLVLILTGSTLCLKQFHPVIY